MTRSGDHDDGEAMVLSDVAEQLLAELPSHHAGRAARTIVSGPVMRATLIALAAGSELAEHDSPPAATLQVVTGGVRLATGDREVAVSAGELVRIPAMRHSVHADREAVFLLTVALR